MKTLKCFAHWFLAALIATVAMSAGAAPSKQYEFRMSPKATLSASPTTIQFIATFKNTTPSGNSTFDSLKIVTGLKEATGIEVLSVDSVEYNTEDKNGNLASPTWSVGSFDLTGTGVSIVGSNQVIAVGGINPPIKPGTPNILRVKFTANVAACTSVNATWTPTVWTGSNFGGDVFNNLTGSLFTTGCNAVLACTEEQTVPPSGVSQTTITRVTDKDNACTTTQIGLNLNFDLVNRNIEILWDEVTYPNVVLKSETDWPIEAIPTNANWPKRTRGAWKAYATGPLAGQPAYIDLPACTSDSQPMFSPLPVTPSSVLSTMPVLTNIGPSTLANSPYSDNERARICIYEETFTVQPPASCPVGATAGCVAVHSLMWISGDLWLSRN